MLLIGAVLFAQDDEMRNSGRRMLIAGLRVIREVGTRYRPRNTHESRLIMTWDLPEVQYNLADVPTACLGRPGQQTRSGSRRLHFFRFVQIWS
jgi:hypothetical protein